MSSRPVAAQHYSNIGHTQHPSTSSLLDGIYRYEQPTPSTTVLGKTKRTHLVRGSFAQRDFLINTGFKYKNGWPSHVEKKRSYLSRFQRNQTWSGCWWSGPAIRITWKVGKKSLCIVLWKRRPLSCDSTTWATFRSISPLPFPLLLLCAVQHWTFWRVWHFWVCAGCFGVLTKVWHGLHDL